MQILEPERRRISRIITSTANPMIVMRCLAESYRLGSSIHICPSDNQRYSHKKAQNTQETFVASVPSCGYVFAVPHPPPPGVAMDSTSPGCTHVVNFEGNVSRFPPFRIKTFDPKAPGSPPFNPYGANFRRSDSNVT